MTMVAGVLALTLLAWAASTGSLRLYAPAEDFIRRALVESAVVGLVVGSIAVVAAQAYLLPEQPFKASDFGQYCAATEGVRVRDFSLIPPQRGLAGAILPGLLAEYVGLVDGLFLSAVFSLCVGTIGLALWARAAFGPGSGALATVMALGFAPFVISGRLLTFAPSTLALAWLAMGLAACAYRFRSGATLQGSAMLLWMDVRGVLWAVVPASVVLVLAIRLNGRVRWGIPVMGLVAASVSWWAAAHTVHPRGTGL